MAQPQVNPFSLIPGRNTTFYSPCILGGLISPAQNFDIFILGKGWIPTRNLRPVSNEGDGKNINSVISSRNRFKIARIRVQHNNLPDWAVVEAFLRKV